MCASAACQDDRKFWSASCTKWRPPREQRGQFTHSARGRAACGHFGVGENASGHRLKALHAPAACLHLDPEHPRPRHGVSRWLRASPSLQPLPADNPTGIVQASTQYTLAGLRVHPTPHLPFLGFVRHCRFLFFFA